MATAPQPQPAPSSYRPEAAILTLGDAFYDPVAPADFPETIVRFRNQRWAEAVGLGDLDEAAWIAHFGRFQALPGSLPEPLALRYHGHQFRSYNPDIGDGRGFLFAQLRDGAKDNGGRLLDLGTKGSGQTPYSRAGDGRLTLKGGIREVLATEMLEALGANTSKSFSLIETGEALHRGDEPSPTRSAVLVRLSHSHVRIGAFQRLAYFRDADSMRALVDYSLSELLGDQPGGSDAPARLLDHVVRNTARLAAAYMAAGFVHGVLNSDNINITGESFDYGPWRWAPTFDPSFTAAYFDHTGLYAYGRQAQAIHWDVVQFAIALRLIAEAEDLAPALDRFAEHYEAAVSRAFLARLGVHPNGDEDDLALVSAIDAALRATQAPLDQFWFDWRGGRLRDPAAEARYGEAFADFRAIVARFAPAVSTDHSYWSDTAPCAMLIDEVEAIWAPIAENDDWSRFHAKVADIRRLGDAMTA